MRCKGADLGQGFCERHIQPATEQGLLVISDACVVDAPATVSVALTVKDPVEAAGLQAGIEAISTPPPTEIAPAASVQVEVEEYMAELVAYLDGLENLVIQTDEDMAYANDVLAYVKSQYKEREERRKKISKPLNDVLKIYNSWFKPSLTFLKDKEKLLKQKIAEATAAARKAQDEALKQIEVSQGAGSAEVLAVAHGRDVVHVPDNVSIREVWDCEIVDPDLVPRAFCDPNPQRLLAYVNAFGAQAEVAGVKFFKKQIVTQRSR